MLKNIGRNNKNEIVLHDSEISNFHAQLIVDDEGNIYINDLSSQNGTYVNGIRINEPTQLKKADIVKIASIPFQWENYAQVAPVITDNPGTPNSSSNSVQAPIALPKKPKSNLFYFGISLVITSVILSGGYLINEYLIKGSDNNGSNTTNNNNNDGSGTNNSENIDCKETDYDYSCLADDDDLGTTEVIDIFRDIVNEGVDLTTVDVTIEEEQEFGEDVYDEIKNDFRFIRNDERLDNLENILNRLEQEIPDKKGFNYKIYLVKHKDDPDMINAFTAGGKIYFTTAMYDFCENDDEIASIVAHEINHNELGHINDQLKVIKSSNLWLPGSGEIAGGMFSFFTMPFNQKNEAECDLHGIDLCKCTGFALCSTVDLWNRMKEDEGEYNVIENLFRTHPYSQKREDCAKHHIKSNYNSDCN